LLETGNQLVTYYARHVAGDAAKTRQRILDAATAEFSAFGMAGARVDRIAAASGSNKAMIYKYFGSKDELFDAVFDAAVVQTQRDVPIDVDDLPEYIARLWDWHRSHPEPLRISRWDALERNGGGAGAAAVRAAVKEKLEVITDGQQRGVVSSALAPDVLLSLLISLSQSELSVTNGSAATERRAAIKLAAQQLVSPVEARS
jgi:AcrR family transcriptional regulator